MAALPEGQLPKPLSVVWCRFPYDQKPGVPGVEPHPGLVFANGRAADGRLVVQVAYGTSNVKPETRPFDFTVHNFRSMQYAGLWNPTRFDLDKLKLLLWDDQWFMSPDLAKYGTPVIGHLMSDSIAHLTHILKRRRDLGMKVPHCEAAKGG
jgi:hypothetical protein